MRPLIWVGGRGTPPGNCKVASATSCPAAGTASSVSSHTLHGSFPAESLNQEKMEQLSWHFRGLIWRGVGGRNPPPLSVPFFFFTKLLE